MRPFDLYKQNIKQMHHLVKDSEYDGAVEGILLVDVEEIKLWNMFKLYEPIFNVCYNRSLYIQCFMIMSLLEPNIRNFLDNVRINVNVESLKRNRIILVKEILFKMNSISNFLKLQ